MNFEKAKQFIYRNARPLDMARWKYLFEGGSKEDVLNALYAYQNADGGFAHALEADCWNPESSPIQTWAATRIIHEMKLEDSSQPVIQGILHYLTSGKDFDGHTWWNTIPSNDAHPHAPWWTYTPVQELPYNPSASLIGFILKFADEQSALYASASELLKEAYTYFETQYTGDSVSTLSCFVELYEYLKETNDKNYLDMEAFKTLLNSHIKQIITRDTSIWEHEYVCKPSQFIHSKQSDFYENNRDICTYEYEFIKRTQNDDGTWNITWSWDDYDVQWQISKNWWKSDWIINNMNFLKAFK